MQIGSERVVGLEKFVNLRCTVSFAGPIILKYFKVNSSIWKSVARSWLTQRESEVLRKAFAESSLLVLNLEDKGSDADMAEALQLAVAFVQEALQKPGSYLASLWQNLALGKCFLRVVVHRSLQTGNAFNPAGVKKTMIKLIGDFARSNLCFLRLGMQSLCCGCDSPPHSCWRMHLGCCASVGERKETSNTTQAPEQSSKVKSRSFVSFVRLEGSRDPFASHESSWIASLFILILFIQNQNKLEQKGYCTNLEQKAYCTCIISVPPRRGWVYRQHQWK